MPLLIVATLLLVGLAGGWWLYSRAVTRAALVELESAVARQEAAQQAAKAAEAKAPADAALALATGESREQVIDDPNGELLWVSPTAGEPISFAYVPTGSQCFVYLRPALLAAHPEGEKVLAAFGPWGQDASEKLRRLARAELSELDAVLVSIRAASGEALDASLRVRLANAWDDAELARRWPEAKAQRHGDHEFYVEGTRASFLAPDGDADGAASRTLVSCPAKFAEELIDSAGAPPMLPRDLESLAATTDADRAVTILVEPRFLAAGGSHLLDGAAQPLRDALTAFVDKGATAIALSAHWDRNFFVELRAAPALNVSPRGLAAGLQKRLTEIPDRMDDVILAQPWPTYGRKVLARFPGMLRQLAAATRRGDADKQAVLRAYLPAVAGHNLLMGAELLLTQQRGVGSPVAEAAADAPSTIAERLAASTTLSFPKDTLQRALELLADDLGAPIVVEGNELRAEGITQNQTLSIDERNRPAAEILVEILRRANPDKQAEGPADPRQKLVYVVQAGDAAGGRIIVTTRAAAQRRGLSLPAVFDGAAE